MLLTNFNELPNGGRDIRPAALTEFGLSVVYSFLTGGRFVGRFSRTRFISFRLNAVFYQPGVA